MVIVIATILDPRYKMMLPCFVFPKIYSPSRAKEELQRVKKTLLELYTMYEICSLLGKMKLMKILRIKRLLMMILIMLFFYLFNKERQKKERSLK